MLSCQSQWPELSLITTNAAFINKTDPSVKLHSRYANVVACAQTHTSFCFFVIALPRGTIANVIRLSWDDSKQLILLLNSTFHHL